MKALQFGFGVQHFLLISNDKSYILKEKSNKHNLMSCLFM